MDAPTELADRYVAVWNETDPQQRRDLVAQLWGPQGEHHVGTRHVRGHDALEERVRASHARNVGERGMRFRRAGGVQALHDAVMFHWEMFDPRRPQGVEALGLQFLRLDADGRIAVDYQFILPTPQPMTPDVMASARAGR